MTCVNNSFKPDAALASVREPHFSVLPEFRDASYCRRYELLQTHCVRERLYDSACFLTSARNSARSGTFGEPVSDMAFTQFAASFFGCVFAFLKSREGCHETASQIEYPRMKNAARMGCVFYFGRAVGSHYVLMCLRLALRALALAGRLPWFAFLSFFPDLAISVSLSSERRGVAGWLQTNEGRESSQEGSPAASGRKAAFDRDLRSRGEEFGKPERIQIANVAISLRRDEPTPFAIVRPHSDLNLRRVTAQSAALNSTAD